MASLVFYLIPGLGANGRIFERLRLLGTVHILEWLEPTNPDELLAAYAARLAAPIPPDETCWLVGVSFGGVVALEIACQRPKARVILISSLADPIERTGWVELGRWFEMTQWRQNSTRCGRLYSASGSWRLASKRERNSAVGLH